MLSIEVDTIHIYYHFKSMLICIHISSVQWLTIDVNQDSLSKSKHRSKFHNQKDKEDNLNLLNHHKIHFYIYIIWSQHHIISRPQLNNLYISLHLSISRKNKDTINTQDFDYSKTDYTSHPNIHTYYQTRPGSLIDHKEYTYPDPFRIQDKDQSILGIQEFQEHHKNGSYICIAFDLKYVSQQGNQYTHLRIHMIHKNMGMSSILSPQGQLQSILVSRDNFLRLH